MNYKKQVNRIIDYIKSGEKNEENFTIGAEFENFIVHKDSLKTVSYYGENGVGETILELSNQLKANPYYDNENILGFTKNDWSVSTEPGSQFELSINSKKTIGELSEKYKDFIKILEPILNRKNQMLIALGYHPVTKIDEITILPKKRYSFMFEHFKKRGNMAHNMMKGTASVQVSIDFKNEADFIKKYFVGSAISPILYTMFDNSFIFESKPYDKQNLRQKIWENTDSNRSGILALAFEKDLSYKKYAEYILNTPPIFMEKDGNVYSTGDKLFKELFDPDNDSDEVIFHMMSIVFPDLRLKKYLEFRMMDAVNYPLNISAVALIKALFYNEKALDDLYLKFKDVSYEDIINTKNSSYNYGYNATYMNEKISDLAKYLINLAKKSLDYDEALYLNPLLELVENNIKPRDEFEKNYLEKGMREAVINNKIEVSDV